ncbi:hypothetical protein SBRY_10132 [Actinacidiphila bryophytorum]|uniref:Uncharacterized protein n=1 Tax=Actinacidiphila bryophytorum TaxID=1436133 RepID=A0A9W4E159_9ACTN|nr:hypothetical protein SBRY_10132 [Actinacidiphila bryophytorum]
MTGITVAYWRCSRTSTPEVRGLRRGFCLSGWDGISHHKTIDRTRGSQIAGRPGKATLTAVR